MELFLEILKLTGLVLLWTVGIPLAFVMLLLVVDVGRALVRTSAHAMRRRHGQRPNPTPRVRHRQLTEDGSVPRRPSGSEEPRWACALLVDVDEVAGRLSPHLQLRGANPPPRAHMLLEVVDDKGVVRHRSRRRLPAGVRGSDFGLAGFDVPEGVSLDDVLGWRWTIVLQENAAERARWQETLRPVGGLNVEAEIEDRAPTPDREVPETLRELTDAEERLLRAVFGPDALRDADRAGAV